MQPGDSTPTIPPNGTPGVRLAGMPVIAPALRYIGWRGHATIFRLLGIDLQAPGQGL